jgi:hypothetical protein
MKPSDADINAALAILRHAGFTCTAPQAGDWITIIDLWRRVGTGTLAAFRDRLHHPRCPQYQRHVGATGRITTLRPTPALLDWLRRPSQPGRRM